MANMPQMTLHTDNSMQWCPKGVELSSLPPVVAGNTIIFGLRPEERNRYKDELQVEVPETDRVLCASVDDGSKFGHGIYCAGYDIQKIVTCEKDGKLHLLVLFSMERFYDRAKYAFMSY